MARKIRSIRSDPRYPDFVKRYRYDWIRFCVEVIGIEPTHQQREIIESTQQVGSRTSVSSGHGTGKSSLTAIMVLVFELTHPNSRSVIIANNARQVQIGVWKNLREYWKEACRRKPWLEQYFVLTDTQFFERSSKGSWSVGSKSCRIGNEEALAGEHAKYLLNVVDEASGVSDKAHGFVGGSCTEEDNRILMLSQPTRPSGFFYDSHHTLAAPIGIWNAIKLNSEESPLVTDRFILEKIVQYGGRESPEYLIKVKGEFPSTVSGFLLGRDECDRAARSNPKLADDWGWVATCDVGNGRDKSVLNICKVSGHRQNRVVVNHLIKEMDGSVDPVRFADFIYAECTQERYPNITIMVDGDGVGYDTATCLERYGVKHVNRIRWGKKMHSTSDKQRFFNQRAYAHIAVRDAIRTNRMKLDTNIKTAEQGSKLPCSINESGQWIMMPKKVMREKFNIKSPDRFDTFCFTMLANYTPANIVVSDEMLEERADVEDWVKDAMIEEDI
ncbi:terminase [Photobacterium leiognathi]|uniref:terminase n=1 Tax=Photobacterium leiognathi TaxID=553611 RepID=UPI001EDFA872|nr:terminase [Photobacterium leiognathi]MCG3884146.1 terminase [Photobacterium leiognathi]